MQSKKVIRRFPSTLLLALAVGSPAAAYDYNHCVGDRIDWGRTTVDIYPHSGPFPFGSAKRSALEAAFAGWHNAPGTQFRYNVIYDNSPTLYFGDGKNSVFTTRDYDWGDAIAVTLWDPQCYWWGWGDLKETDVIFNDNVTWSFEVNPSSPPSPFSPYNFALVGIHELGHAFGLNHQLSTIATMNDIYPIGGTLGNYNSVQPHSDDVYGNRVGYGTCCTQRDVYASTYTSTSQTTTGRIPGPSQAYAGSSVSFQFSIGNRGTTNEGSVRVQYYLSTDRFISTSDTYLGAATFSMSSGGTSTFTATGVIPANQQSGTYYLGWVVDPLGSIPEVDESNNAVALVSPTLVTQYSSVCGNRVCESGESASSCLDDCPICGDSICGPVESSSSCPNDCPVVCGDSICSSGEDSFNCPGDCGTCGNFDCDPGEDYSCPEDCAICGNFVCEPGEDPFSCSSDCCVPGECQ